VAETSNPRAVYNAGYDHTCAGFVVRLVGGEHLATFKRRVDADEYVGLVAAHETAAVPTKDEVLEALRAGRVTYPPEIQPAGRWMHAEETSAVQKHYPEEWGPSDARRLTCACGDPDPFHTERAASNGNAVPSEKS